MVSLSLSEKEVELLRKSINHCMESCGDNNANGVCPDCESLRLVLNKLPV